jgi:hypothetical protein
MKREGSVGKMLIRGIEVDSDDEDDENENENGDRKPLTAAQCAVLRHIVITKPRAKALDEFADFVTCGQASEGICMFGTTEGNHVCWGTPEMVKRCLKKKKVSQRFDALLGLTRNLERYDYWMSDNECWSPGEQLEEAIDALGKAWKGLLKKTDEQLGIDAEFTRPGVEAMLEQFANTVSEHEASSQYDFKWQ